jgi:dTDP-4-amino-4,6-dideoxygalactose transaminase
MNPIYFNEPFLTGNELKYIEDVFKEKRFYGCGKYTDLSKDLIKKRLSVDHVILTDSCTAALEISALLLRDYTKEQEVILPSYAFTSTASAFLRAGFKLVFAEIEDKSFMLDLEDVKAKITPKTTCIVLLHYAGYCADIHSFRNLCQEKEIFLVEDAAQAFDSFSEGKALGSFGSMGCFSFHETKNIHAGLSGALIVKDEKLARRAQYILERGTNRQDVLKKLADKYTWVEVGGSLAPTELQAAFLCAQLEGLDTNKEKRQEIYATYKKHLTKLKEKNLLNFPEYPKNYESNYHAFINIFNSSHECDLVREYLLTKNIHAYIGYVPLHSSPVGIRLGYQKDSLPKTEELAKRILRLPFHNNLTVSQVEFVCHSIEEALTR